MDYEKYVELGKELLNKVEDYQLKICKYAMEVCTIRHGGHSKGYYTIKDYARDIGMNTKTLQNWLITYRNVVLKLSIDQQANLNWNKASKVNNVLEENRTMDNAINKKPRTRDAFKKHLAPEKVQKIYDAYSEQKPFEGEFVNMVQQTKGFKNLLEKRDLSIVEDKHLAHFMTLLDECSDLINEYLTLKKKAG
jgi:transposase-like protein